MIEGIGLPLRPTNDDEFKTISKREKDCLVYSVLFGCKNEVAFVLFNSEYSTPEGRMTSAGKQPCKNFFSYAKHREFIDAYKETLSAFLGNKKNSNTLAITDLSDSQKEKSVKKFTNKVYQALEDASGLEELKVAADLGKTTKIFKEEEVTIAPPIRCLTEQCYRCKYKIFVDENMELGNIVETEEE